jgi:hypothetical protein
MNLNERMSQFRLASRDLYNIYFYTHDKVSASEAEERYSDVLESLFINIVSRPEGLTEIPYYETQKEITVTLPNTATGKYLIDVETKPGNWEHLTISCSCAEQVLKLNFECYFDWNNSKIKDNRYISGPIISFVGNEELNGKQALIEASDAVFLKA